LFDIVRISEGGATNTRNTTDSEAQLIGRGARYFPFEYEGEHSFKRRFDTLHSDLKVLEALHYHTINNNTYINNLEKSLEAANIQVREDQYERLEARIKPSFRKHSAFKEGKIYINKLIETTADDYDRIDKYNIQTDYEIPFEKVIEQRYGSQLQDNFNQHTHEDEWKVDKIFIRKAIQRTPFFQFSNLKNYVPAITSMKSFIESPSFLCNFTLYVSLPSVMNLKEVKPIDKLKMVEQFFNYMERNIRLNYNIELVTPVFEGVTLSKLINNYQIEFYKVNSRVSSFDEIVESRNMRGQDWFIYDNAIVNNLESSMIDFIADYLDELEEKYDDVFLIRNERKVKIVEIDGVRGFMPDFLLYLQKEGITYQVFLEPKGDHLRLQDQWKEEFITSLTEREDVEVLSENKDVRLVGIKFYSDTPTLKSEFRSDFINKL